MKALILIDLQNEWVTSTSDYYIGSDLSAYIEKVNTIIGFCRKHEYRIIFTKHVETGSGPEFKGKRADLLANICTNKTDTVVEKHKISSFYETDMSDKLKGVDSVVVLGILTNLCVRSFVEDAYDREFDITILSDCCRSFDKKTHDFTLSDLENTRDEIKIVTSRELIKK